MELVALNSSMLSEAAYNEANWTLELTFSKLGQVYTYEGVPGEVFEALISAPSAGHYFRDHIADQFPYVRPDGTRVAWGRPTSKAALVAAELIEARGWSMEDLARLTGETPTAIRACYRDGVDLSPGVEAYLVRLTEFMVDDAESAAVRLAMAETALGRPRVTEPARR